jgi:hypothetical protein
LKDALKGVHIALEGVTRDEIRLVAVSYQYSWKATLFFLATENAGTTKNGDPNQIKYNDSFGNVCKKAGWPARYD